MSKAQKTTFDPIVSLTIVNAVLKSFEGEAKAVAKARIAQDACIQKMLDAFWVACPTDKATFLKGNAATNAARFQVKGVFDAIAEKGFISKSSAASYQSAFWIAFEKGIPFQRDLNNKPAKPEGGTGGTEGKTPPSGTVEKTDVPALHKTLSRALAQARTLNQSTFVADLTDLILTTWPEFKETVLKK